MAQLRYRAAFRIGVVMGLAFYPLFEAREWVYRTFFRDAWLARNRRLKDQVGPLLERFDKLSGGAPDEETWPDFLERISKEQSRE
jgi:hypothetical protein